MPVPGFGASFLSSASSVAPRNVTIRAVIPRRAWCFIRLDLSLLLRDSRIRGAELDIGQLAFVVVHGLADGLSRKIRGELLVAKLENVRAWGGMLMILKLPSSTETARSSPRERDQDQETDHGDAADAATVLPTAKSGDYGASSSITTSVDCPFLIVNFFFTCFLSR